MTDPETLISVRQAIDEYSLLCFPDQDMSDEKQLAFTKLLGTPEAEHVLYGSTGEVSYFGTVGNVKDDGSLQDQTNARYQSCLLYTSPSPRDQRGSRMPSSA